MEKGSTENPPVVDLILDFLLSKNLTQTAEAFKKEYAVAGSLSGNVVSQLEVLLEGLPSSFSIGDSKLDEYDSGTEDREINQLWSFEEHASAKNSKVYANPTFLSASPTTSLSSSVSPELVGMGSEDSSTSKSTETLLQQLLTNLNEFRREDDEDQWAEDDSGYRRIPIDEFYLAQYPEEVESDSDHVEDSLFENYKQVHDGLDDSNSKSTDVETARQSGVVAAAPPAAPQPQEPEYDSFDLKVIFVKNRTGFEESKDFPIKLNTLIAGRYEIKEYLGSAAFSSAIQCYDTLTKRMVCIKIITNNKDFFDQSLDEIKLLKYINANCNPDEKNVLQLYDYFYHKEHLFIVCELLRDNLYEFYKYNRSSGDELYFTLPRLKKVARQCLIAMSYIHSLNLIHCDLKPENILIKSYSRCEVKIIDFGSSCFTNDTLGTYVQSRAYRAPEVVLGLPYNQKIDIWSLGCIFAELWTGTVLFLNDSVATLLARINAILGPFPKEMLEKGRYTSKFFTKRTNVLYEKREGKTGYSFLCPKKTSLKHRLKTNDDCFVDFIHKLLTLSPSERPTAEEALNHPWLNS